MRGNILTTFRRFVFEPANPQPLGFLRISISLLAIIQVFIFWSSLLQLYGNFGFIQWAIIEADNDLWIPSIGKLCLFLQPYGVSSSACVYGVFILYLFCVFNLLIGFKTRIFAIGACILHSLTINSGYYSVYGVDTMLHICLYYCIWMPVGKAFSVDSYLRREPVLPSFAAGLSIRALQLHLCIIYLNTGLAKMQGEQWWSGEAIWRAVMLPQFAVYDLSWLAYFPFLAKAACWSVMLLETGYVFFIWHSKIRGFWLTAIISLHIGIGALMGLWLFSSMMIIMNIAAFGFTIIFNRQSSRDFDKATEKIKVPPIMIKQ